MINYDFVGTVCMFMIAVAYYLKIKYHYEAINWDRGQKLSFVESYRSLSLFDSFIASFPIPIVSARTPRAIKIKVWVSFILIILSVIVLVISIVLKSRN